MQLISFSRLRAGLGLLLLGSLPASNASADVTVAVSATKDAMIFGTSTDQDTGNASGRGPGLFAGADSGSRIKRSMITFDLAAAAIPGNATITGVTMTLYLAQVAGSGGGTSTGGTYPSRTLRLFSLQEDWAEGPSGLPTSPTVGGTGQGYVRQVGDSSWDYALYAATTWQPGGDMVATDSAAIAFEEPFVLNQAFTWSSAGMLSDVRNWQTGTTSNFGWMIISDLETSPTSFLGFWSRDGAAANNNPAIAPQLSITYACDGNCVGSGSGSGSGGSGSGSGSGGSGGDGTGHAGCSTSAPGSLSLLAVAGLMMRRRRRVAHRA